MKKKYRKIFLAAVFLAVFFPFLSCAQESASLEELSELYAQSAALVDADSGRVLFGKGENTQRPMASTTKIMTCILALENMREKQTVSVSAHAAGQPAVSLGMTEKEEFYIEDLLYSIMLESHNDSAVAIAEGIAGSAEAFAGMMNKKAEGLGLTRTHFVTPNGLDGSDGGGSHSTTARELALIMRYCIKSSPKREEFLKITQTPSYAFCDVQEKRSFSCRNHNAFLHMMKGAFSGKTGFTAKAGYCYVGALKEGKRTFIVTLLACGWPHHKGYKWSDTKRLMQYGLAHYDYKNICEEGSTAALEDKKISVKGGIPNGGRVSGSSSVKIEAKKEKALFLLGDTEEITTDVSYVEELKAPVRKGARIGTVRYKAGKEILREFPIIIGEGRGRRTFWWCFQRLLKGYAMREGAF